MIDNDMKLPEGKTCKDCWHFLNKCSQIFGIRGQETECDFSPSRFFTPPKTQPSHETVDGPNAAEADDILGKPHYAAGR